MPEERITIDIDEDGIITAKTSGFKGEACLNAVMELLDKDSTPMLMKLTDDYYEKQDVTVKNTLVQRGKL